MIRRHVNLVTHAATFSSGACPPGAGLAPGPGAGVPPGPRSPAVVVAQDSSPVTHITMTTSDNAT